MNLIPTTEIIEERPSEPINNEWKLELAEKMRAIYNKKVDKTQKLLRYFEIGKILYDHPVKYQRQLQKLK